MTIKNNKDNLQDKKEEYKKEISYNRIKIIGSVVFLVVLIPFSKYILFPISDRVDSLVRIGNNYILSSDLFSTVVPLSFFPLTSFYRLSKYSENKELSKLINKNDVSCSVDDVKKECIIEKGKNNNYNNSYINYDCYDIGKSSSKVRNLVKKK